MPFSPMHTDTTYSIKSSRDSVAAILAESRAPLIVDTIQLPEELDYGQVLVKVLFSGICGSQLGEIDARKGPDNFLPHLLGHEASAEVLQCGPGVRHVSEGDRVVLHWRKGLGIEAMPPVYSWKGKQLNAGWIATFSQQAIISENRMTRVPSDIPEHLLPLFGCAITTGMGVAAHDAHIRSGESIVIFGAGGVGLSVVQGAALAGAYPVIAVDLFDARVELAKRLGATHGVNASQCNAVEKVRAILASLNQPEGADVCIDNTGDTTLIAQAYHLAHARGRIVCVGVPSAGHELCIPTLPLHFGKSIIGSHGGDTIPQDDIPRYLRLARAGKLELAPLVTETCPLREINSAIERMRSGKLVGRCVLDCA